MNKILRNILILGFIIMNNVATSAMSQTKPKTDLNGESLQKFEYVLPYDLGRLSFHAPVYYQGYLSTNNLEFDYEAVWINDDGEPFKDHVVLTIAKGRKKSDVETFLDLSIQHTIDNMSLPGSSTVKKSKNARWLRYSRVVEGISLTDTVFSQYKEFAGSAHLITLTHTTEKGGLVLDLDTVEIQMPQSNPETNLAVEPLEKFEYVLPHDLGRLSFHAPAYYQRYEKPKIREINYEAIWFTDSEKPTRDTVVLAISEVKKSSDVEAYLDASIQTTLDMSSLPGTSTIKKSKNSRWFRYTRGFKGSSLVHTTFRQYKEIAGSAHLIELVHIADKDGLALDLDTVEIQ